MFEPRKNKKTRRDEGDFQVRIFNGSANLNICPICKAKLDQAGRCTSSNCPRFGKRNKHY